MSLLGIHTYVGRFYADRVDLVCDPPGVIRVSFDKMILTVWAKGGLASIHIANVLGRWHLKHILKV